MDKINWANYNDEEFTLFCNALLTFEVGKNYRGFSAKGKDGDIDGSFNGEYTGIRGLWRFQYKFRQGTRREEVNRLKGSIKKELSSLNNENVFFLVTNLEILPQELKGLEQTFAAEVARLKKDCVCLVWDGAKIFTLCLQYPVLLYWLLEGFYTAQLQGYQSVFRKNCAIPY